MRLFALILLAVTISLMATSTAWAAQSRYGPLVKDRSNPYEGWTLQQVKVDAGFHSLTLHGAITPSRAREGAETGAPPAFDWIGYIVLPRDYYGTYAAVYFDRTGAGVTMVVDPYGDDETVVPIWCVGCVPYLFEMGVFEGAY